MMEEKGEMKQVGDALCASVNATAKTEGVFGVVNFLRLFTDFARNDVPDTRATDVFRTVSEELRALSWSSLDRSTQKNSSRTP